jgi:hypothetical protein
LFNNRAIQYGGVSRCKGDPVPASITYGPLRSSSGEVILEKWRIRGIGALDSESESSSDDEPPPLVRRTTSPRRIRASPLSGRAPAAASSSDEPHQAG